MIRPLVAHETTVGRLRISGRCDQGSIFTWVGDIIAGLKAFETEMLSLLEEELDHSGGQDQQVPVGATTVK